MRTCLTLLFILKIFTLFGQNDSVIALNQDDLDTAKNLLPLTEVWIDASQKADFQSVKAEKFVPFDTAKIREFKKWTNYWLKITLHNASDTAILRGGFSTKMTSEIHLYSENLHIKNGRDVPYAQRAFPSDQQFLPFQLSEKETRTFYCQVITQDLSTKPTVFVLKSTEKHEKDRLIEISNNTDKIFFRCFFVGLLMIVSVVALVWYRFLSQKALIYYALFCLSNALFFLRSLENISGWNILFAALGNVMWFEAPASYISLLAYVLFFSTFLEIPTKFAQLNRIFRVMVKAIILAFFVDIFLQLFVSLSASLTMLEIFRSSFFAFMLYVFYLIFTKFRNPQGYWLGAGTLIVILGALLTNFETWFNAHTDSFWGGAMRKVDFSAFSIYWYDMKTALLLEVACFSAAIILGIRADSEAKKQIEKRNATLSAEAERLNKELALANITLKNRLETTENEYVLRGLKIIEAHLSDEDFSVEKFAYEMNMDRSAFSIKWKKEANETPLETIHGVRMEHAVRLLSQSKLSISEICYQIGIKNPSTFSKTFKNHFGKSPSEFRKNTGGT